MSKTQKHLGKGSSVWLYSPSCRRNFSHSSCSSAADDMKSELINPTRSKIPIFYLFFSFCCTLWNQSTTQKSEKAIGLSMGPTLSSSSQYLDPCWDQRCHSKFFDLHSLFPFHIPTQILYALKGYTSQNWNHCIMKEVKISKTIEQ